MARKFRQFCLAAAALSVALSCAQTPDYPEPKNYKNRALRVSGRKPSPEEMRNLKVPAGFALNIFAQGLENPRMLAVGPGGAVYVTQQDAGSVMMLRDKDGDGTAEERSEVASIPDVHGITVHGNQVFLASPPTLFVADLQRDGTLGKPRELASLAPGGRHPNRTLGVGPDGKLYINIGSTCNACDEPNKRNATMLQSDLDGKNMRIWARGLRNTTGFFWHPKTKEMWGMDHGTDWFGDDIPPEELNRLVEGDFGWPYCYDKRIVAPITLEPQGTTKQKFCPTTEPMVLGYTAHASPIGAAYYDAQQFPPEYRNSAYWAMRGSWNRQPASGYKIVRLKFNDAGQPTGFEDFVTGFLLPDGATHIGRVAGVAVAKDGSLLFSDDSNGIIYRVSYKGGEKRK